LSTPSMPIRACCFVARGRDRRRAVTAKARGEDRSTASWDDAGVLRDALRLAAGLQNDLNELLGDVGDARFRIGGAAEPDRVLILPDVFPAGITDPQMTIELRPAVFRQLVPEVQVEK